MHQASTLFAFFLNTSVPEELVEKSRARECINWLCFCFYRTAAADLHPCEPDADTHCTLSLFTLPLEFATLAST